MFATGLVIMVTGLGDKGFQTIVLKMVGPSIMVCGGVLVCLSVLLCLLPCRGGKGRTVIQSDCKNEVRGEAGGDSGEEEAGGHAGDSGLGEAGGHDGGCSCMNGGFEFGQ